MITRKVLYICLVSCVSCFLLDDVKTTATLATLTNQELMQLLMEEKTLRLQEVSSLTQRVSSLENAFTDLFHKVEHINRPGVSSSSQIIATNRNITTKIVSLEKNMTEMQGNIARCLAVKQNITTTVNMLTGLNSSVSNNSDWVEKLVHTQLKVNDIMANFDRRMNNLSVTFNNNLLQQNNISSQTTTLASAVETLASNQSSTAMQLKRLNQTLQQSQSLIDVVHTKQNTMMSQQYLQNSRLVNLISQQNVTMSNISSLNSMLVYLSTQHTATMSNMSTLNSTLVYLSTQQKATMSNMSTLNSRLVYMSTQQNATASSLSVLNNIMGYLSTTLPVAFNNTISQLITSQQQDEAYFFSVTNYPDRFSMIQDPNNSELVIVHFNKVRLNIGGGYDNKTGEFTSKRAGVYLFTLTNTNFIKDSEFVLCSLELNNTEPMGPDDFLLNNINTGHILSSATKSTFIVLKPNETVRVVCLNTTDLYEVQPDPYRISSINFIGGLIHPL